MSDKKAPTPGSEKDTSKDVPLVTEKAAPKSNFAKADQSRGKDTNPQSASKPDSSKPAGTKPSSGRSTGKKTRGWLWFWLFVLLLILLAVAAWYFVPQVRQQVNQQLSGLPLVGKYVNGGPAASTSTPQATSTTPSAPASSTPESTTNSSDTQQAADNEPDSAAPTTGMPSVTPSQPETAVAPRPEQQPSNTSPTPPPTEDKSVQLLRRIQEQAHIIGQLQQQLARMQRDVTAQGNRLSQLGNASREDWQLAEADYLLRLANQRLMLEQDSRAALGLVQEVDKILRDVDLPDLYGVRQQLARDLTALKLVQNVDREGLYLRLRALEEQMVTLNIQPKFDLAAQQGVSASEDAAPGKDNVQSSWNNFVNFLKGSVRIRDAEIDPVLLSPQSETRFRQSLRLSMEQAELALLRANETVYKDALNRARDLLQEYGIDNPQRQVILRELEELASENIATDLPELSASQSALRNYIDRMHKVSSGQDPDSSSRIPGGNDQ